MSTTPHLAHDTTTNQSSGPFRLTNQRTAILTNQNTEPTMILTNQNREPTMIQTNQNRERLNAILEKVVRSIASPLSPISSLRSGFRKLRILMWRVSGPCHLGHQNTIMANLPCLEPVIPTPNLLRGHDPRAGPRHCSTPFVTGRARAPSCQQ